MKPIELKHIIAAIYGKGGGRKLARDMGVHENTVSRWVRGVLPIGEQEKRFIHLIHFLTIEQIEWRDYVTSQEAD